LSRRFRREGEQEQLAESLRDIEHQASAAGQHLGEERGAQAEPPKSYYARKDVPKEPSVYSQFNGPRGLFAGM